MSRDPIVDEVRRVREVEAAKYGFDVKAILAASKRRQRRSRHKVVLRVSRKKLSAGSGEIGTPDPWSASEKLARPAFGGHVYPPAPRSFRISSSRSPIRLSLDSQKIEEGKKE